MDFLLPATSHSPLSNSTIALAPLFSTFTMLSLSFVRLLSLVVSASPLAFAAPSGSTKAEVALSALQTWYNTTSGIYDTTGWWNSANALTTLGDLAAIDASVLPTANSVFPNSLVQARKSDLAPKLLFPYPTTRVRRHAYVKNSIIQKQEETRC